MVCVSQYLPDTAEKTCQEAGFALFPYPALTPQNTLGSLSDKKHTLLIAPETSQFMRCVELEDLAG